MRNVLKNKVFMRMAIELSKLGTCCRLKVGCILLREDGSIASGGYNGSLPGMSHCTTETCNDKQRCLHTAHAEENALFFSEGPVKTAYLTHQPCLKCLRMMVRRGVRVIYFNKEYNSMPIQERAECLEIISYFNIIMVHLSDVD